MTQAGSSELILEAPPALAGGVEQARERPDEPRAGTWFRRRMGVVRGLRELWCFRELVITLAERDLRIRYKQAVLGVAWALFMPLLLMIVFSFVFTKVGHVNTHGAPYQLYAYLGLVPWSFFAASLSVGGLALVNNILLLNKLYCPREVFALAAVAVALVDAVIATLVLVLMFVITGFSPQPESYYVPLLVAVVLAFTIGVTMVISAITVYMRDLRVLLPLVVQFGLFFTPIAYGAHTIAGHGAGYVVYSAVNPLAPAIEGLRRTVLVGQPPEWIPLLAGGLVSLVVLLGGFALFKRLETGIADIA
jgi:ABC-type polysaccharide/polyol phosphate export permease